MSLYDHPVQCPVCHKIVSNLRKHQSKGRCSYQHARHLGLKTARKVNVK